MGGVCEGCMRTFDPIALTDDGYCEECDGISREEDEGEGDE